MNLKTRKNLVSTSKYDIKCPYSLNPKSITIHNTANKASAINEVNYMINNNNKVSYHWAVDDKEAVLGIPEDRNAWHCGNSTGNRNSLSIEICYSTLGGSKFSQAEENAAYLAAMKLKEYGLGIDKLRTHQSWSGKYCPHRTLDYGWDRFVNMVKGFMNNINITEKPTVQPNETYNGNSIVDYLHSIGEKGSFSRRKELAVEYGVSNYKGTAEQNLELLNKMRNGKPQQTTPTPVSSGYTGSSIVDYLVSIGQDPSYNNRAKLARQYGISGYRGTASQNRTLLNAMRGNTSKPSVSPARYCCFNNNSIVDGLRSVGIDSSKTSRRKIARLNGISNYSGTAYQNETLCNLARKGKLRIA